VSIISYAPGLGPMAGPGDWPKDTLFPESQSR
jgi:hypothetical protein